MTRHGGDGEFLAVASLAALESGDPAQAQALARKSLGSGARHREASLALGTALLLAGDPAAAEEAFKQLLAQGDTDARRGLAIAFALQGRVDEARRVMAHLQPDDAAAQLANAVLENGSKAADEPGATVRAVTGRRRRAGEPL